MTSIERSIDAQRLLRLGSWSSLLRLPIGLLTGPFVIFASAVCAVWLGVAFVSAPAEQAGPLPLAVSVAILVGATALLGVGCVATYWLLLAVRLLSGASGITGAAAILIWVLVSLPNIGVLLAPHPLNLLQYVSIQSVRSEPRLFAVLLLAALCIAATCSNAARWRDTGSGRPSADARKVALVFAVAISALGAISVSPRSQTTIAALSEVFFGTGGPLIQYLLGMTIILSLSFGATAHFATDWIRRDALIRLRTVTTARWVRTALVDEALWALRSLTLIAAVIVFLRFAANGAQSVVVLNEAIDAVALFGRILGSVILFAVLSTLALVLFTSDTAIAVTGCILLTAGLIPSFWSPWNPLLAWSGQWVGENASIATLTLTSAVVVGLCLLTIFIKSSRESEVHRVSHSNAERVEIL